MKRIIALVLSFIFVLSFAACGKAPVQDTSDRGLVAIYLDGKEIASVTMADFQKKTVTSKIGDDTYYGKALVDIINVVDVGTAKAAFTKSADGFAQYFSDAADLFIATHKVDGENYESIKNDAGEENFTALTANKKAKEVTEIYLLTTAQDWQVSVDLNGEKKTVTIEDFMAMKPQYKELSHKFNGGADEFTGEFLCVDSKTFWEAMGAELVEGKNDEGMPVYYVDGTELTVTGYAQGSNQELKLKINKDLKGDPLKEKTAWLVYYFVLINGGDTHEVGTSSPMDLDLSCIYDGTGIRWMTTPITELTVAPPVADED